MSTSLDTARLREIIASFEGMRVGVIGDVMLDIFTRGSVERISPEAPVPVVLTEREQEMLGGAGNVAVGAVAFDSAVTLLGLKGNDRAGDAISLLISDSGIEDLMVTDAERRTTVKHRIITQDTHVLRVDWESPHAVTGTSAEVLLSALDKMLPAIDVLIVADYAKGVITESIAAAIIERARNQGVPVTVDTKPAHFPYFKHVSLISPNHHEAVALTGTNDMQVAGPQLVRDSNSRILITQGAQGMELFTEDASTHIPTHATSVVDVSGAGDTVSVAISLAFAAGATDIEALTIASMAAGAVVGKPGTASVTREELLALL